MRRGDKQCSLMEQNNLQIPGISADAGGGAAYPGAFSPDLAELIAAWPTLEPAFRAKIMKFTRARKS